MNLLGIDPSRLTGDAGHAWLMQFFVKT
jgi:hypothetical protein